MINMVLLINYEASVSEMSFVSVTLFTKLPAYYLSRTLIPRFPPEPAITMPGLKMLCLKLRKK